MGNRANFVIVKDQDWQLYYSHWGGCRMLDALIGGPELALRYAASLRRCEKDEWCDPKWADGGALIDLDRRRVLFFGEPLMVEMNERRALMSVLATVWPGYEICWAYDGTEELAGYVGAQLRPSTWDRQPTLKLARGRKHLCVSLAGFSTYIQEGIELAVGQTANIPVVLQVGGLEQSVTVRADSPVVETTCATSSL